MKIYISGKITGLDFQKAKSFFREAHLNLTAQGSHALNPMTEVSFNADRSWSDYMRDALKLLLDCDAIFMLKNWEESKGAKLEYHIAKELGLKILYEVQLN